MNHNRARKLSVVMLSASLSLLLAACHAVPPGQGSSSVQESSQAASSEQSSSAPVSSEPASSAENSSEQTVELEGEKVPASAASGKGGDDGQKQEQPAADVNVRPVLTHVLSPVAAGTAVLENESALLDYSNAGQGYVMLNYKGTNSKVKTRVQKNGGTVYTYSIPVGSNYHTFPLTEGNGDYTVSVFENVTGNQYVQVFGETVSVALENNFLPFLYPNQYVSFSEGSKAVALGAELAAKASDDMGTVTQIYNYTIKNITYDDAKAASVQSGYLPNVDSVLASKKGICFDYAALMTAMLRSQNIPTKLVVGYAGDLYHAWISVYLKESGWVDNAIYFDGKNWKLMDPTFASGSSSYQDVANPSTYQAKYIY